MAGGEGASEIDYLRSINEKLDVLIQCVCPPAGLEGERELQPKRPLAPGTAAWMAFVKHVKSTMPERFEGVSQESHKLAVAKAIRDENPAAYEDFVRRFREENPELQNKAAKLQKLKKAAAPSYFPPKKEPKKAAASGGATGGATAGKAPPPTPVNLGEVGEGTGLHHLQIGANNYILDPEWNGVYVMEPDGSIGDWVGYYQPGNLEEPIRRTNAPNNMGGGGRRRRRTLRRKQHKRRTHTRKT